MTRESTGDPGVPFDDALASVRDFYAEHGLPAWAQVEVGSEAADLFGDRGWRSARPGEADSRFQIAPVSGADGQSQPAIVVDPEGLDGNTDQSAPTTSTPSSGSGSGSGSGGGSGSSKNGGP